MVAVEYPRACRRATDFIIRAHPSLRVEVWRVDGQKPIPQNVLDEDGIRQSFGKDRAWRPSVHEPMRSMVRLQAMVAGATHEGSFAGGFYAAGYGRYRAHIETAFDLPVLEDVPTQIVIDQLYNTGK
jgi:hypothetical protein